MGSQINNMLVKIITVVKDAKILCSAVSFPLRTIKKRKTSLVRNKIYWYKEPLVEHREWSIGTGNNLQFLRPSGRLHVIYIHCLEKRPRKEPIYSSHLYIGCFLLISVFQRILANEDCASSTRGIQNPAVLPNRNVNERFVTLFIFSKHFVSSWYLFREWLQLTLNSIHST